MKCRAGNGVQFTNSSYGRFTGSSRDRGLVASGNVRLQKFALGMASGAADLQARFHSDGNLSGHVQNGWHENVDIAVNGYDGMQSVAYAAAITPNPTNGKMIHVGTLTGPMTVNGPAAANTWTGAEMTIVFTQDGAGGRVVTFESNDSGEYRINWTPNTGAGKVNIITVKYDGTLERWVQASAEVNL